MKNYTNTKQKLLYEWNQLHKNNNSITNQLIVTSDVNKKLELASRTLLLDKKIVDFSSDWQTLNVKASTNEYYINYQIIFEKINIKVLAFLQSHFVYTVGSSDSEIRLQDTLISLNNAALDGGSSFRVNEVVQLIDLGTIDSAEIKKVVWNKSLYITKATAPGFQVKLFAQLINPRLYI